MPRAVHQPMKTVVALAAALLALLAVDVAVPAADAAARLGARTLDRGDRGRDVRALQRLLGRAGFGARVDGVFGPGTEAAVLRAERELALRADGRVTRREVRRLRAAVGRSRGTGGFTAGEEASSEAATAGARAPRTTPGSQARLTADGLAVAPEDAPEAVKQIIAAANRIARTPYRYGGGHGRWEDTAYDCSGSVSYALHGAGLLPRPMPSGSFTGWGAAGEGEWVTIYANGGHMYMTVAGLRFDTSGRARSGSRWQREARSTSGYAVRHPAGL